ncbi:MAG TPA: Flp family type IVb pilin [Stellaceae bacterium]|nr:Flp family type IVb pilin [Stellaceae bacterium]
MLTFINRFHRDESGATMVEYGLLVALIALVVGLGAQIVGTQLSSMFSKIGSYVGAITVPTA